MAATIEQVRQEITEAIKEHGLEEIRQAVCADFQKMVKGTRARLKLDLKIIAIGYERLDPDGLEIAVQYVLEAMPDDHAEKDQLQTDLDYWKEHRREIMDDHNVTSST